MASPGAVGFRWRREHGRVGRRSATPILVAGSLISLYAAALITGGAPNPLVHLAYIAVVGAAVTRGLRGGVIAGLAAGVLFGPLMPVNAAASAQFLGSWAWLVRLVAFAVAGLVVGAISERSLKMAGRLRDGEERRRAEAAIRDKEEWLRDLVEANPVGIVVLDGTGRITNANRAAARLLGTSPAALIGTSGNLVRRVMTPNGELVDNLGKIARRALRAGTLLPPVDLVSELPEDERILVSMEITPLLSSHDPLIGAAITLRDVTADREIEVRRRTRDADLQRVARLAVAEPTGVAACERLLAEFARMWPVVSAAIYTFTDDGARRLAEWAQPGLGFRYPARASLAEAARLREFAESGRPVRLALVRVFADRSARDAIERRGGRTTVIAPLVAGDTLVGALIIADTHGRARAHDIAEIGSLALLGQVCAAAVQRTLLDEESDDLQARQRVGMILEGPELLVPAFQPIVSLVDGRVVGYEALSRFPAEPYEPPSVWFSDAHRVGLGSELQTLAIRRALAVATAAGLPDGTFLSLNASPRLLADPMLDRATSGFPLERVVIEITEEEAIGDYAIMRDVLGPYRAAGARVAIDDVGAGHASLRHVTELQPDFVKLDAQLMPHLGSDRAAQAMVRALSGFAAEIGAVLIAEGVERQEDLALLARTRLPIMMQGFAIARPGAPWPEILPLARQTWAATGNPRPAAMAASRAVGANRI